MIEAKIVGITLMILAWVFLEIAARSPEWPVDDE